MLQNHMDFDMRNWHNKLEAALENGAHAWGALERAGQLPPEASTDRWPPTCSEGEDFRNVGQVPYHLAAMIRYVQIVWQCLDGYVSNDDLIDG